MNSQKHNSQYLQNQPVSSDKQQTSHVKKKRLRIYNSDDKSKKSKYEQGFSFQSNSQSKRNSYVNYFEKITSSLEEEYINELESFLKHMEKNESAEDINFKKKIAQVPIVAYNYFSEADKKVIVNYQDLEASRIIQYAKKDNIIQDLIDYGYKVLFTLKKKFLAYKNMVGKYCF